MNMENIGPDKSSTTPHYLQIAKNIRSYISEHSVDVGEALPSERELCLVTGASRVTIRKALDKLANDSIVQRRHGAGTFVLPHITHLGSRLNGFTGNAYDHGHNPESIWIMKAYDLPSTEEAEILEISLSDKVVRLGRVRLANGEPLAIEHALVPAVLLPELSKISESLYRALEAKNHRPVQGSQKVQASLANSKEAKLLSIEENSEILRIERRSFLSDGTPVELTRSAYRGDRYDIVMDLGNSQLG